MITVADDAVAHSNAHLQREGHLACLRHEPFKSSRKELLLMDPMTLIAGWHGPRGSFIHNSCVWLSAHTRADWGNA
jgi:hypothetical protein